MEQEQREDTNKVTTKQDVCKEGNENKLEKCNEARIPGEYSRA